MIHGLSNVKKQDVSTNVYWSSCKVSIILVRFSSNVHLLDFSFFFLEKSSNIKFRGNAPSGSRVVPIVRADGTDGHTDGQT